MRPRITLVHGWAYDASMWRAVVPLLAELDAELDVEVADLGYFGRPALPVACDVPRIAVGHSLGALWWLTATDLPWNTLIAINAFPRFTAAADFPAGVAPRVLDRMRKRFATQPEAVLNDFYLACGQPGSHVNSNGSVARDNACSRASPAPTKPFHQRDCLLPFDQPTLKSGLDQLANADGRITLQQRVSSVHVLASRQDNIVSAAMSEAAFSELPSSQVHWVEHGDHVLPLSHPQACADLIHAAAAAYSK